MTEKHPFVVGRYALFDEIAAGGMATVHFGRLVGPVGFSRTVAIKRLHPQFAKDSEFSAMFLDEARLASRIQHPNVVATVDVVEMTGELLLVMEYVAGEALSKLIRAAGRRGDYLPFDIVSASIVGMLHGLHAAHEAKSEKREALNIVHRDVSPQNCLVGIDGISRVLDFGVAKAAMRSQSTQDGQMKGKLSYMSPEQLSGKEVDRRTDVFAAGVVLWESLCGRRLFAGSDAGEILGKVLHQPIPEPKEFRSDIPEVLNAVVMKALDRDVETRYQSAREFAIALEEAVAPAPAHRVGTFVEELGGENLAQRAQLIAEIEEYSLDNIEELSNKSAVSNVAMRAPLLSYAESTSGIGYAGDVSQSGVLTASHQLGGTTSKSKKAGLLLIALSALVAAAFLGARLAGQSPSTDPRASMQAEGRSSKPETVAAHPGMTDTEKASAVEPSSPEEPSSIEEEPAAITEPAAAVPEQVEAVVPAPVPSVQPKPKTVASTSPAPAKPAASNCEPPWTLDSKGIKRLKPGCI